MGILNMVLRRQSYLDIDADMYIRYIYFIFILIAFIFFFFVVTWPSCISHCQIFAIVLAIFVHVQDISKRYDSYLSQNYKT